MTTALTPGLGLQVTEATVVFTRAEIKLGAALLQHEDTLASSLQSQYSIITVAYLEMM